MLRQVLARVVETCVRRATRARTRTREGARQHSGEGLRSPPAVATRRACGLTRTSRPQSRGRCPRRPPPLPWPWPPPTTTMRTIYAPSVSERSRSAPQDAASLSTARARGRHVRDFGPFPRQPRLRRGRRSCRVSARGTIPAVARPVARRGGAGHLPVARHGSWGLRARPHAGGGARRR